VVVAILNLIWVPIVAFADIAIPTMILTLPIIASFIVSLVHFVALYRLRVHVKRPDAGRHDRGDVGAWTVSRASSQGLNHRASALRPHLEGGCRLNVDRIPGVLGGRDRVLLLVGRHRLIVMNGSKQCAKSTCSPPSWCWESLPFLSAVDRAHWKTPASTRSPSGATARCAQRN